MKRSSLPGFADLITSMDMAGALSSGLNNAYPDICRTIQERPQPDLSPADLEAIEKARLKRERKALAKSQTKHFKK